MNIRSIFGSPGYGLRNKRKGEEKSRFSQSRWRVAALVTIVFAMLVASSCVDLSVIGHLAKSSQDVGSGFKSIADNAEPSCKRATSYISSLPLDSPMRPKALPNCGFYKTIEPSVLDVNDALFKYIAALGKLASSGKAKEDFDKVDTDLKKFDPNISPTYQKEAKAAGGLADALKDLLASRYQERELAKIIGNANDSVKNVTDFLSGYAADQYDVGLQEEGSTRGTTAKTEVKRSTRPG